jgi:hypothetical protein
MVDDKQISLVEKPLHPNAVALASETVSDFSTALIVLAKTLAYQRRDDEVLSTHVYEAVEIIQNRKKRKRWKDFMLAVGGAMFGAFVSGFATQLNTGDSKVLLAFYVTVGLLGMILIFAGLQD